MGFVKHVVIGLAWTVAIVVGLFWIAVVIWTVGKVL